jgi:GTPase SAR1 family protein
MMPPARVGKPLVACRPTKLFSHPVVVKVPGQNSEQAPAPQGLKLRHLLSGGEAILGGVAWSPDGRLIAVCEGHRGSVRIFDAIGGLTRRTIRHHRGATYAVAWSPDGRSVASSSWDYTITISDAETGELRRTLSQAYSVKGVAWSPDGSLIAAGSDSHKISVWKVADGSLYRTIAGHTSTACDVLWSSGGKALISGGWDGTVRLWDLETGAQRWRYQCPSDELVLGLALSPDERLMAACGTDGRVSIVDPESGQALLLLEGVTKRAFCPSFSYDGLLLAVKAEDNKVCLWRTDTWQVVAVIEEESAGDFAAGVAFHPLTHALATLGNRDRAVRVWDIDVASLFSGAGGPDAVFYTTAKIALVGDSGVGKTGLGWRIAHREFKEHPSTHGQQFWVIDEFGARRANGTECEAVLWDLAGQPDYRLVHALFLDDVDLALVLFDPTDRQEPLKGVEYWLRLLGRDRQDGRSRRAILVGARADRGVPTLTSEELEEVCKRYGVSGGYVGTSALTGEGLEELLARVKAAIVWDEMPATVTTKTFKRVKEFVLSLKEDDSRKGVLVGLAQLRARLEAIDAAWAFTDAEMMTAVRHLSNHGYVTVLRSSSGEEIILLTPDLLANLAASFVLEARRNPRGLGALEEARVLEGAYAFPELTWLDEAERDVLLDAATVLFLEHNLCFRETLGSQIFLIFPALINQKRPLLEEVEMVDDFSYRVSGAVEKVYAALVVQLGYTNTFTRTAQWQNQAQYETARGDVCGFRQVNEREGETELVLYYARERPGARLLFQGLFEQFLRGRDVTATKFPPVPCPECGYRQPRGEVIKRIGEGKGFLFCGECGVRIVLPKEGERIMLSRAEREQLGEEQERARRRTAFESALVRVKAVARDERKRPPSCFISYAWGDAGQERWVRGLSNDLQNAGVEVIVDQNNDSPIGANVARFISRIETCDFVVAVGTPRYRLKYENNVSPEGSVVAAEVDLINLRLLSTEEKKRTVLPLLLEGDEETSFPPLLQGKVWGDFLNKDSGSFLNEKLYFANLFDLILTLYRIPFEHPAVSDLRDSLRAGAERWR